MSKHGDHGSFMPMAMEGQVKEAFWILYYSSMCCKTDIVLWHQCRKLTYCIQYTHYTQHRISESGMTVHYPESPGTAKHTYYSNTPV